MHWSYIFLALTHRYDAADFYAVSRKSHMMHYTLVLLPGCHRMHCTFILLLGRVTWCITYNPKPGRLIWCIRHLCCCQEGYDEWITHLYYCQSVIWYITSITEHKTVVTALLMWWSFCATPLTCLVCCYQSPVTCSRSILLSSRPTQCSLVVMVPARFVSLSRDLDYWGISISMG